MIPCGILEGFHVETWKDFLRYCERILFGILEVFAAVSRKESPKYRKDSLRNTARAPGRFPEIAESRKIYLLNHERIPFGIQIPILLERLSKRFHSVSQKDFAWNTRRIFFEVLEGFICLTSFFSKSSSRLKV